MRYDSQSLHRSLRKLTSIHPFSKPGALNININKAVDKAYETKSLKEIADAPVDALEGVSAGDAELLAKAFGIKTIRDLGSNKFFLVAQAIAALAAKEE